MVTNSTITYKIKPQLKRRALKLFATISMTVAYKYSSILLTMEAIQLKIPKANAN